MSSLQGLKPHTNGWYQDRTSGEMIQVVRSTYERVKFIKEVSGAERVIATEDFYKEFRRVRDYKPVWRHPWENK